MGALPIFSDSQTGKTAVEFPTTGVGFEVLATVVKATP
jgi:hypothetical protein